MERAAARSKYELGLSYEKLDDLEAATNAYIEAIRADQSLEAATIALLSLGAKDEEKTPDRLSGEGEEQEPISVTLARFGLNDPALAKHMGLQGYELRCLCKF